MITVDASVWTSVFELKDCFHADSVTFLRHCERRGIRICSPWLTILETGCALARRSRDGAKVMAAVSDLRAIPTLRLLELDNAMLNTSLEHGTRFFLRGADAIYAATARITRTQLITWDQELIERAGGITPTEWLDKQK
ncbi:MAG: type II toxin-antitoxin system VapC family toxin [Bdellovibrionaceae bacterium]|nr:type II toxin-antitoxin system VapC family toxin [Pseudobdellovibrionaceae bacterium]